MITRPPSQSGDEAGRSSARDTEGSLVASETETVAAVDLREPLDVPAHRRAYVDATDRPGASLEPDELPFFRSWLSLGGVPDEAQVFHRLYLNRRSRRTAPGPEISISLLPDQPDDV